tara:strand:+ start:637 stop:864 length:228 start_codon:yes stop_codon:yes gene_type:complete
MSAMGEQEVIEGWRGVCVAVGLGQPYQRGFCAALLTGMGMFALKPRSAFKRDGSPDGRAFILTPLAVGAAVACLT